MTERIKIRPLNWSFSNESKIERQQDMNVSKKKQFTFIWNWIIEIVSLIEFAISSSEIYFDSSRIAYHFTWLEALSAPLSHSLATKTYCTNIFFPFFSLHHFDGAKRSKKMANRLLCSTPFIQRSCYGIGMFHVIAVSVCKCIGIISTAKTNKTQTAMLYLLDIRNRIEFKIKLVKHVPMSRCQ